MRCACESLLGVLLRASLDLYVPRRGRSQKMERPVYSWVTRHMGEILRQISSNPMLTKVDVLERVRS